MLFGPNKHPLRRRLGFQPTFEYEEDSMENTVTGGQMREPANHIPGDLGGGDSWMTPPYAKEDR